MTIRKLAGQNKWRVLSAGTKRNMGTYTSKAKAEARLKQVEMFSGKRRWSR